MRTSRTLAEGALIAALVVAGSTSCKWRFGDSASADCARPLVIERYDNALRAYPDMDSAQRADFRRNYSEVNAILLPLYAASHPQQAATAGDGDDERLSAYARSRGVAMFGRAVSERLGSLDSTELALGRAAQRASQIVPELHWPRLYGVISTYSQSIILGGDSLALIGLNHYLGANDEAYAGFDAYQRRSKRLAALPAQLVESLLAAQSPYQPSEGNATALSRMLYEGATLWLTAQVTGIDDPAQLLDWSVDDAAWAVANEPMAWDALIRRNLLYSTDEAVGNRLVRRAPSTPLLHPEAPGRMGAWLGYRIVDAYTRSHPDAGRWQLLQCDFYCSVSSLVDAGYNPLHKAVN